MQNMLQASYKFPSILAFSLPYDVYSGFEYNRAIRKVALAIPTPKRSPEKGISFSGTAFWHNLGKFQA